MPTTTEALHEVIQQAIARDPRIKRMRDRELDRDMLAVFTALDRPLPQESCPIEPIECDIPNRDVFRAACPNHPCPVGATMDIERIPEMSIQYIVEFRSQVWQSFRIGRRRIFVGQCPKCLTIFHAS